MHVCFDFVSYLSSEEESLHTDSRNVNNKNTVFLSHQWNKVCSQETMPGDRNSTLCSQCVSFMFAWGCCILLFKNFCILCSLL